MTGAATAAALVQARGLCKSYRRGPEVVQALDHADFTLHRGEVVALVGPSGSGKTTLVNVLAGWEVPEAGEVVWSGPQRAAADRRWDDVAILPQQVGLVEELSVRENIALPVRLARPSHAAPVVDELIAELGLGDLAERLPEEASLGEQQRTGLARALVLCPRLLLADEPTGHQDESWARAVFDALRRAAADGATCLVATHDPEVLEHMDRVLNIHDGKINQAR